MSPPPLGGAGAVDCAISINGSDSSEKEKPSSSIPASPPMSPDGPYSVDTDSSGGGAGNEFCASALNGSRAQAAMVVRKSFINVLLAADETQCFVRVSFRSSKLQPVAMRRGHR